MDDLDTLLERKRQIIQTGVQFPMCSKCNDIYRFALDSTPDSRPLSEWIYALAGGQEPDSAKLMQVVRRQQDRIDELERLVAAYERGRFMRFTKWLRQVKQKLSRGNAGRDER
jgi:hypothetical protein